MIATENSLRAAETIRRHKWNYDPNAKKPKPHPVDYFVPNFGLDRDIVDTQASIAAQEAKHGKWVPVQDDNGVWIVPQAANNKSYTYKSLLQLDAESDPVCPSSGCPKNKFHGGPTHPMDYFVPHFG